MVRYRKPLPEDNKGSTVIFLFSAGDTITPVRGRRSYPSGPRVGAQRTCEHRKEGVGEGRDENVVSNPKSTLRSHGLRQVPERQVE